MISSLLHLVGLRPRVYYTLTNFRGGGQGPLAPPPQYANVCGPRIYKPLVIIIAPLTVWIGSCRLFRASGELRIAIINHGLKRFPVVNCGSVTVGDFPPIPDSKTYAKIPQ